MSSLTSRSRTRRRSARRPRWTSASPLPRRHPRPRRAAMRRRRVPELRLQRRLHLVIDASRAWRGVLAALALVWLSAAAWEQDAPSAEAQPIPPLRARVTDLTGTLSASDRQALDAKLGA